MLEISLEFRKGLLFVRFFGSLTKITVHQLEEEVTQVIEEHGIREVVFNMEDLVELDLKGIHGLFHSYEVCSKNHGKIFVCGLRNRTVKERMGKSRLLHYLLETKDELSTFSYTE